MYYAGLVPRGQIRGLLSVTNIMERSIQLVYFPGTFGNCLQWCVEKFLPGSAITDDYPWDKDGRVHQEDWPYQKIFQSVHQIHTPGATEYDDSKPTVVITFEKKHLLLAERLYYYRVVQGDRQKFLAHRDKTWLMETFGPDYAESDSVIKELYKLFFHSKNKSWWDSMESHMSNPNNFVFPLYALLDMDALVYHLNALSDRFDLNLKVDRGVLRSIVDHTNNSRQIITMNRAEKILDALKNDNDIECDDLDLLEQAWIETRLESQQLIFPYGTQWFKHTRQIKDFINTRPNYLKHNHNLPWIDKRS